MWATVVRTAVCGLHDAPLLERVVQRGPCFHQGSIAQDASQVTIQDVADGELRLSGEHARLHATVRHYSYNAIPASTAELIDCLGIAT